MATVLAFPASLPALVANLATVRLRIATCDANPRDGDGWDDFQRRKSKLEADIADQVYAQTGCALNMLVAVMS